MAPTVPPVLTTSYFALSFPPGLWYCRLTLLPQYPLLIRVPASLLKMEFDKFLSTVA